MKRTIVLSLVFQIFLAASFGQTSLNRYEVEILKNPNPGKKDTREVNAVLIFEKDGIKIQSRRSPEVFKQFSYSDIRSVEHSFSRKPEFQMSERTAIILSVISGMPLFLLSRGKEKHWLMITTDEDYAVLKIENDNYRLLKQEFVVKKIAIAETDEDK